MKSLSFLFTFMTLISTFTVGAQTSTNRVELRNRSHVPLYDCSILRDFRDRDTCQFLKGNHYFGWNNQGYAVNCNEFSRQRRNDCFRLADVLTYNEFAFDCYSIYDRESERQCNITKNAYGEGRFSFRDENRRIETVTTIIESRPAYNGICSENSYDESFRRWSELKEEQRRRGQTRAAVGIAATIGGIILGNSGNRDVRNLGQGLVIGGAFVTTWGLIEMMDADLSAPHLIPGCDDYFTREARMVVVEQRECVSTRYTERNRHSSRSYYEIRCENRSYITYEEFSPWQQSRRIVRY